MGQPDKSQSSNTLSAGYCSESRSSFTTYCL